MNITRQELENVARLARLHMNEDELARMTGHLDAILGYVAKLGELDTEGVAPTHHPQAGRNALREDEIQPSLSPEQALANAPQHNEAAFLVPRVIH